MQSDKFILYKCILIYMIAHLAGVGKNSATKQVADM